MKAAHAEGKLAPGLQATYFTSPRPVYELYDLDNDPSELENLSGRPGLAAVERELRIALAEKMILDFDYLPLPAIPETGGGENKAGKRKAGESNRAAAFTRLDTNADGRLTEAEFSVGRAPEEAGRWFKARDTNGDGFLSREEYLPQSVPGQRR